ncbi:MAG: hypothetical protein SGPRY_015050, partial [Prymnesium sp.]
FAKTCMDKPDELVILTDLPVVVSNMLRGPAGPLRDCKLFPTAPSLVAMDQQTSRMQQQLFPGQGTGPAEDIPDVFRGFLDKFK